MQLFVPWSVANGEQGHAINRIVAPSCSGTRERLKKAATKHDIGFRRRLRVRTSGAFLFH